MSPIIHIPVIELVISWETPKLVNFETGLMPVLRPGFLII